MAHSASPSQNSETNAHPDSPSAQPVLTADDLCNWFASGEKTKQDWRIGTEHEKFVYHLDDLSPVAWEGQKNTQHPYGIKDLLEKFLAYGWQGIFEQDKIIGLKRGDGSSITLEPGGQLELSGAPLANIHQSCVEVQDHLSCARQACEELGMGMLGLGFHPFATQAQIHWMPKDRYRIMRNYMPQKGQKGLDMMVRTCTVQANFDFSDEADMVKKFRVSLALQPLATAIFANSPFYEGKPNGYVSYRSHIWTDTDPDRCGDLPFVFEEGFGYQAYVEYLLDVPMYFIRRDHLYIDASGLSFRDFLAGKLPILPGQFPTLADWEDHVSIVFPEVRLKKYLEMRGADSGPWRRLCALPALWTGLLYEQSALDAAWDLVKGWDARTRQELREQVPKTGLATSYPGGTVQKLAQEVIDIAAHGLQKRAQLDAFGEDEQHFLTSLKTIIAKGTSPAQDMLDQYHNSWKGDLRRVFEHAKF